jgi:hypothetical protein
VGELRKLGRDNQVTLLYAAHDPEVNHALVLWSVVQRGFKGERIIPAKKAARKEDLGVDNAHFGRVPAIYAGQAWRRRAWSKLEEYLIGR